MVIKSLFPEYHFDELGDYIPDNIGGGWWLYVCVCDALASKHK